MPISLKTSKKQIITIEDNPLASGGEGSVHKIISPSSLNNSCVKIYSPQCRTRQREQKISYMVYNPPPNLQTSNYLICWPNELVYENNNFTGFIMPLALNGSILLYELCTTKINSNLPSVWNNKFDRSMTDGFVSRLKLCVNIAIAVHCIHCLSRYVLVDMKPQNILVTHDGIICIIDSDSIQIKNGKKVIYPGPVATPEYMPPEGKRITPSKDLIPDYWDKFSIAVIFYEILFGLHPFASTAGGIYRDSTTIIDKIHNGLSHLGINSKYIETLPPLHNNFNIVPQSIQYLFYKAFKDGHNNPNMRPSAEKWGDTIYGEINNKKINLGSIANVHRQNKSSISLTKVICQNCRKENYQLGDYCGECGSFVTKKYSVNSQNLSVGLKFCGNCGTKLGSGLFCPNCGIDLRSLI